MVRVKSVIYANRTVSGLVRLISNFYSASA